MLVSQASPLVVGGIMHVQHSEQVIRYDIQHEMAKEVHRIRYRLGRAVRRLLREKRRSEDQLVVMLRSTKLHIVGLMPSGTQPSIQAAIVHAAVPAVEIAISYIVPTTS
mmetsp:Transcript_2923/g.5691  ORF Transcript_2923/g.5691 Transcript_2923/m.5691 type:complete len:109 (+) Transcript_2923:269-595(+)